MSKKIYKLPTDTKKMQRQHFWWCTCLLYIYLSFIASSHLCLLI